MQRHAANVYRLGIKELRSLRADPVLVFLILYTFTFAIYFVATGVQFEVRDAAVAILDEDQSQLSRSIRDAILPPHFKPPRDVAADAIDAALDRGAFVFVIEIPAGFEADLLAGRPPTIQLDVDATAMTEAGNGAAYLQTIISREIARFTTRSDAAAAAPIDLVIRAKFNPNLESGWFTAVMQVINNVTMLSAILAGAALIREREQGTIEHLLVMPVTPADIMLSKVWANGVVIVAASLLSLVVVVELILQVPIAGSLALFALGAVLYQFSVTALGLLLATFTTSMPQFDLLILPVLVVLNLLSGSTTPMECMPIWLQDLMFLSPARHFVGFAQAVLYRGAGIGIVWPSRATIAAISAALFAATLARFRKAIVAVQ